MSMLIFKSLFIVPQYMWLVAQWCPILRTHGPYRSRILCPQESPGKNAGVRSHSLHQGIVLNQGLNPHLPALQADFFYCLRHQGSLLQLQIIKRKRKKELHSICRVILEIIDIFIFSLPIHEYGLSLLFKHCQYISIKCYNFLKNLNS